MISLPSPSRFLAPLLAAAGAAWLGWTAVSAWQQPDSGQVTSLDAPRTLVRSTGKGNPIAPADDPFTRLALFGIPNGAEMRFEDIIALYPPPPRQTALQRAVQNCLLAEFLQKKPQAALEAALRGANGYTPASACLQVLNAWLTVDLDGAVAAFDGLPLPVREEVSQQFGQALAAANPRKAIRFAESGGLPLAENNWKKPQLLRSATNELAHSDPEAATMVAAGVLASSKRLGEWRETVGPALREWLKADPAAARRWLEEHRDDGGGILGIESAAAIFQSDLSEGARLMDEAVKRWAELNPGRKLRDYEWREIARSMAESNPEKALAHAKEMVDDNPLRHALFETAATESAKDMPPDKKLASLSEVISHSEAGDGSFRFWRVNSIVQTMGQLAAIDSRAALEQARNFADAPLATAAVLNWVMQNSPESAPAMLRETLESTEMAAALAKLESDRYWSIGNGSPMDYGSLLTEVPEAAVLVNGTMLEQWSAANPVSAAAFLKKQLETGRTPAGAQRMVVNWAMSDGPNAAAWVETLPAGNFRNDAAANVADTWSRVDSAAAQKWRAALSKP